MPVVRNVIARRSRRLSKQAPRTDGDDGWEQWDEITTSTVPEPPAIASTVTSPSPLPISSAVPVLLEHADSFFRPRSSHSRKRKEGHIPRPPNAFMLFRSDFWTKQKVTPNVERDHRHISRIAGHCWNNLSEVERAPYKRRAEIEKARHALLYPQYRYSPVCRREKPTKRRVNRDGEDESERCKAIADLVMQGLEGQKLEERIKGDHDGDYVPLPSSSSRPKPRSRARLAPAKFPAVHPAPYPPPKELQVPAVKLEILSPQETAYDTPNMPSLAHEEEFVATDDIPTLHLSAENSERKDQAQQKLIKLDLQPPQLVLGNGHEEFQFNAEPRVVPFEVYQMLSSSSDNITQDLTYFDNDQPPMTNSELKEIITPDSPIIFKNPFSCASLFGDSNPLVDNMAPVSPCTTATSSANAPSESSITCEASASSKDRDADVNQATEHFSFEEWIHPELLRD